MMDFTVDPGRCVYCSHNLDDHIKDEWEGSKVFHVERLTYCNNFVPATALNLLQRAEQYVKELRENSEAQGRLINKLTPLMIAAGVNPATGDPFVAKPSASTTPEPPEGISPLTGVEQAGSKGVGNDGDHLVRPDKDGDPYKRFLDKLPELMPRDPLAPAGDGYDSLRDVLREAVEQASVGKGKERHAGHGEAFEDQQIVQEGRWIGSNHGQIFQARKKAMESTRLPPDRARAELLGAIVYIAAAYLLLPDGDLGSSSAR